jgi:hypothetical protein
MTLHGFSLGVLLALAGTQAACGGSSSETPPPLQPDPKGFHYAGAAPLEREASDAGPAPVANDSDDDDKPHAPARSTWGAPPPHH